MTRRRGIARKCPQQRVLCSRLQPLCKPARKTDANISTTHNRHGTNLMTLHSLRDNHVETSSLAPEGPDSCYRRASEAGASTSEGGSRRNVVFESGPFRLSRSLGYSSQTLMRPRAGDSGLTELGAWRFPAQKNGCNEGVGVLTLRHCTVRVDVWRCWICRRTRATIDPNG